MKQRLSAIIALYFAFSYVLFAQNSGLIITEVQPSNHVTLSDEDGNYEDWIELYNPTAAPINLAGWSLTDDATNHKKWTMTGGSIPAGGFKIVFASSKDRKTGVNLHTNFRLTATGDYLALYDPSGNRVVELNPIPRIDDDFSYGSYNGAWVDYTIPTPGSANTLNGMYRFPTPIFSVKHGLYSDPFDLTLTCPVPDAQIIYTLDGSEPTMANSNVYETIPIGVPGNTIVRAKVVKNPASNSFLEDSRTVTQSYLFPYDIIYQSNTPNGYPAKWGPFAVRLSSWPDSAVADYEMDPELISNPVFAEKVIRSFSELPIISIVTDKENLFSKSTDTLKGGIYIYTNPPQTGRPQLGADWERPASIEYFFAGKDESVQTNCGLQLHGGHSRYAEKSPKHSFRVDFNDEYGIGKLRFPLMGDSGPKEINSFFLRAGYGNTWLHGTSSQGVTAVYVRDTWAKLTQLRMSNFGSHTSYAHLFLNGMYWGLYNPEERIDDDFAEYWWGGQKEDYDVIKVSEDVGIEASRGTKVAWQNLMDLSTSAYTPEGYQLLLGKNADRTENPNKPALLDVDNFIDYMLLNFYAGNSDWDYHNWISLYNRNDSTTGFRFICWDSEMIISGKNDNIVSKVSSDPTKLFSRLKSNPLFVRRVGDRAQKHLFNNGWLSSEKAAQTFTDLTSQIEGALYAESARWGDYRRDVFSYAAGSNTKGSYPLFRKDVQFDAQKVKFLTDYFPNRTGIFVTQLKSAGLFPSVEGPTIKVNSVVAGDTVTSEQTVTMTAPAGTIYYTLNGTDPVYFSDAGVGTLTANALTYAGAISPTSDLHVMARCLNNSVWSALSDKTLIYKLITGVRTVKANECIAAAYPTAFKTFTEFRFELPVAGRVRLELFDASGRKVSTLLDEQRNAGSGTMNYDGSSLSPGVYICRFTIEGVSKPHTFRIVKM